MASHDEQQHLHFQIPNFVLGGTPNVAHGGGAEVLTGMYGQGPQVWSEYDKYWYDPAPSKDYALSDLALDPPSSNPTPTTRVCMTPRPFEFGSPPIIALPSPGMPAVVSDGETLVQDQRVLPFSTPPPVPPPSHVTYTFPDPNFLDPTAPLPPLPPHGLPLYSASGFDMLRMLAKVATRPNPKIMLGPVDMTCSFVVVDVRRLDSPIVYASPTFTRLTGYSEAEVLGRNCRFLQHPSGQIQRGDTRQFTAPDAVRHLHKSLLQDKECQASLINYRKDGAAFINLVTVIPISSPEDERDGESGEITHCVGFQVDLAEQPNAILQKLRDGSYIVNYSSADVGAAGLMGSPGYGLSGRGMGRERRGKGVSAEMIDLLRSTRAYLGMRPGGQIGDVGIKGARDNDRAELHSLLLENTDDFIHVVSLKGSLLYVAPAVTRVLGHNPADLVGKSIADLCHPADVVPLMRELKDASSGPGPHAMPPQHHTHGQATLGHVGAAGPLFMLPTPQHASAPPPKPVHLLFRAQYQDAGGTGYVWLEARGRLHVEQGKGRKAIVLVGRRVDVPRLKWGALARVQRVFSGAGGMQGREEGDRGAVTTGGEVAKEVDECWGLVAPNGIVLSASPMGAQRLGFAAAPAPSASAVGAGHHLTAPGDPATLVGRSLTSLVVPEEGRRVGEVLADAACLDRDEVRRVRCRMRVWGHGGAMVQGQVQAQVPGHEGMAEFQHGAEGESIPVEMRFFAQERERGDGESWSGEGRKRVPSLPPSLVFQMLFLEEVVDGAPGRLLHAHAHSPSSCRPVHHSLSPDAVSPPSASSSSYTPRSVLQQGSPVSMEQSMASPTGTGGMATFPRPRVPLQNVRARTPQPAHVNILAELSTAAPPAPASSLSSTTAPSGSTSAEAVETSWQYELTRLRFENERMREEVRRLERMRRGVGMTRMRARTVMGGGVGAGGAGMRRGGVEPGMSMAMSMSPPSTSPVDASHVHGMGMGMGLPLPPTGVPQKRTREGEMK